MTMPKIRNRASDAQRDERPQDNGRDAEIGNLARLMELVGVTLTMIDHSWGEDDRPLKEQVADWLDEYPAYWTPLDGWEEIVYYVVKKHGYWRLPQEAKDFVARYGCDRETLLMFGLNPDGPAD
jgi:hypothetical protein